MSLISIIAAIAENNAIGKDGQLLWHLPADMRHFKELTTGHAVIMGRKTFESLPNGPLPNRKNIVLTSLPAAGFAGCLACKSMREALGLCGKEDEIFIIGGALVYRQALDIAGKMYITRVHHAFEDADAFFPAVDWDLWEEADRQAFPADGKNAYPCTFLTYIRNHQKKYDT